MKNKVILSDVYPTWEEVSLTKSGYIAQRSERLAKVSAKNYEVVLPKFSNENNDSIIALLLNFNQKNPVYYKDKWIPIGELEKMLDKLPAISNRDDAK